MELRMQRVGDCVVVHLPASLCFYESRAETIIEQLGKIAEDLHRQARPLVKGVLLLQQGIADDRLSSWLDELASTCLFSDLVHRIDTWRWLLSLIRNSPVPWVYAAASSCRGSAWELALSCQRRYWYATRAEVGFPEIAAGAFPPGGVLESLNKRTGRTKERWQAQPVFSAPDALADGLLDFCSDALDWMARASTMFHDMLRFSPSSGVRELRRQRGRDDQATGEVHSDRAAFAHIEGVWRRERAGTAMPPVAWEYCWQLIKERGRLKPGGNLGQLVCLIASQHLLSVSYALWLKSSVIVAKGAEPLQAALPVLPPVIIDLSAAAPPTAVILGLLRSSVPVVFAAAESRDLVIAINLQFSRLERTVGLARANELWEHRVTWYQGAVDPSQNLVLRWTLDEAFHVLIGADDWRFLRLEGNAGAAALGAVEWTQLSDQPLPAAVQSILAQVCDTVIHVQQPANSLPASVHIRSLFFEEMLHLCRYTDGDLGLLAGQLKASGWGFASEDDSWDRFLRTRFDAYRFDAAAAGLGERSVSRGHWEISSWKQAKAEARRTAAADSRWNKVAVSHHMALFLGILADLLANSRRVSSPETADYLCNVALGLPISFGSSLTYLRRRGRRRVEHYAALHWPRAPMTRITHAP